MWFLLTPSLAAAGKSHANILGQLEAAKDQQVGPSDLERLRSLLEKSGPDGKTDRESAVAQLLALPTPEAHRLLQERLLRKQDPDGLRLTILTALQGHLLGSSATQFGGAAETVRKLIIAGYLDACAPLWSSADDVVDVATAPVLIAARQALRRVPVRELDTAARTLMKSIEAPRDRLLVLRCLADMQQTLLADTIADQLDAQEQIVRDGAQAALWLLTYADSPIRTLKDFEAWSARFGSMRYVDLVERAARNGPATAGRLRDEIARLRVDHAREFVTVHVAAKPGINWAAVQERTLSDGPAVLDACLQALQAVFVQATSVDGATLPRQAFFRALLVRFAKLGDSQELDVQRRRALLLEVAAYLVKPDETEFANEIRSLLIAHLSSPSDDCQMAALRGLRRFPSVAARQALVSRARELVAQGVNKQEQLQLMLDTLASRTEPIWVAPSPDDADKADWLALIEESCRTSVELGLRAKALLLAQTADRTGARVKEAFAVVLGLAKDARLETAFRATCLIFFDAWRNNEQLAEEWLAAMHEFLAHDEPALRRQAAESLQRLPASTDPRRALWFKSSMTLLTERLVVEPDAAVLKALVDCVKVIGREPQMSEGSISALKFVLSQLGSPVSPENTFRVAPLLQALGEIAAEPNTEADQWLAACEPLAVHGERTSLRLVLSSHDAINLAKDVKDPKDVSSAEKIVVDRACLAMRYLIEAAALKPSTDAWASTEDLKSEARDVRLAFKALDNAEPSRRLDQPQHRLLRLNVALVAGDFQEVVVRATAWLQVADAAAATQDASYLDELRLLAAKAQLELAKPLLALALINARQTSAVPTPDTLELCSRIATALVEVQPESAVALFESTLKATSKDDPQFRIRLLDWMRTRIRHDPSKRKETIAKGDTYAALFEASDCPEPLRTAFQQLRSSN